MRPLFFLRSKVARKTHGERLAWESAAPETITYTSETKFGSAVYGKDPAEVFEIMDELMTALQVMMPRLYDGVLRKIQK